jgi:hypothetical protein
MFTYINIGGNNGEEISVKRKILEQTCGKYLEKRLHRANKNS